MLFHHSLTRRTQSMPSCASAEEVPPSALLALLALRFALPSPPSLHWWAAISTSLASTSLAPPS